MKKSNEQKSNLIQRLLTSTLKFTKDHDDARSKSPANQFKYELPKSFLNAVDDVRIKGGYDVLPRFVQRSTSSSSSSSSSRYQCQKHLQTVSDIFRSSSLTDVDRIPTKKIPFRRMPREHARQHHQTTAPLLLSPRPAFRMMMNPHFIMMNRCRRPLNIMPMRSPIRMQQRPIFRHRFP